MPLHLITPVWNPVLNWTFTDPEHGLTNEPLVDGADTLCERLLSTLDADPFEYRFHLVFGDTKISRSAMKLVRWEKPSPLLPNQDFGTWYIAPHFGALPVWLCPNLSHYFSTPPEIIFCEAHAASAEPREILRAYSEIGSAHTV